MGKAKHFTATIHGVEVKVSSQIADDFELLEKIAEVDSGKGNTHDIVSLFKEVFGADYAKVKDAIRAEHGYVSTDAMIAALTEVFTQFPK